jgi:hypothetical protein
MDPVIIALSIWVAASWAAFSIESVALYMWVRRQGAPVSFMWSNASGITVRTYRRWCREHGLLPDEQRLARHRMFVRNFCASLVGFVAIFVLLAIRAR